MAHLPCDPLGIGGAGAQHADDFLVQCAHVWRRLARSVHMIERGRIAQSLRGGGKTALVFGEGVGVQHILLGHVLHMHEGVGARHLIAKGPTRRNTIAGRAIGVGAGGQIGFAQFLARGPCVLRKRGGEADSISAGRGAEDAQGLGLRGATGGGDGIVFVVFVEQRNGLHGGIKQRDLRGEDIAEEAGNTQGHIHARAVERGLRQDLETRHARRGLIPHRLRADQRHGLRQIIAARAHGGAAPQINHDGARPVAMVLRIACNHLLRRALADFPGGAGGHGARVDGIEIAPGRQHIKPAARGRARRAGLNKATIERAQQTADFRLRRGLQIAAIQRR